MDPLGQADEVVGLLNRLIPDHAHLFTVSVHTEQTFSKDKVQAQYFVSSGLYVFNS